MPLIIHSSDPISRKRRFGNYDPGFGYRGFALFRRDRSVLGGFQREHSLHIAPVQAEGYSGGPSH